MRFKIKPFIGFEIDQTISWENNFTIQRLTYSTTWPIPKKTRPFVS